MAKAKKRYVTEMGMGVDVHGRNYTGAAERAVFDAIHHSSLNFFRVLDKSPNDMVLDVLIGVPEPDKVDKVVVEKALPYGTVTVKVEKGLALRVPTASITVGLQAIVEIERGHLISRLPAKPASTCCTLISTDANRSVALVD